MVGTQPGQGSGDWALAACAWVMSAGGDAAPGRSLHSLTLLPLGLQTVPGPADDEDEEEDEDDDAGGGGGNIEPDDDEGYDDEDDEDDEEPWQVRAGRRGSAPLHADLR